MRLQSVILAAILAAASIAHGAPIPADDAQGQSGHLKAASSAQDAPVPTKGAKSEAILNLIENLKQEQNNEPVRVNPERQRELLTAVNERKAAQAAQVEQDQPADLTHTREEELEKIKNHHKVTEGLQTWGEKIAKAAALNSPTPKHAEVVGPKIATSPTAPSPASTHAQDDAPPRKSLDGVRGLVQGNKDHYNSLSRKEGTPTPPEAATVPHSGSLDNVKDVVPNTVAHYNALSPSPSSSSLAPSAADKAEDKLIEHPESKSLKIGDVASSSSTNLDKGSSHTIDDTGAKSTKISDVASSSSTKLDKGSSHTIDDTDAKSAKVGGVASTSGTKLKGSLLRSWSSNDVYRWYPKTPSRKTLRQILLKESQDEAAKAAKAARSLEQLGDAAKKRSRYHRFKKGFTNRIKGFTDSIKGFTGKITDSIGSAFSSEGIVGKLFKNIRP